MNIRLTPREKELLLSVVNRYNWKGDLRVTDHDHVAVAEPDATDLRELCSDYLTEIGFDGNYEPNDQGKILEALVDKLYVP